MARGWWWGLLVVLQLGLAGCALDWDWDSGTSKLLENRVNGNPDVKMPLCRTDIQCAAAWKIMKADFAHYCGEPVEDASGKVMRASGKLFNGTGPMSCVAYQQLREDGLTVIVADIHCDEPGVCQDHVRMLAMAINMRANSAARNSNLQQDFNKGLTYPRKVVK